MKLAQKLAQLATTLEGNGRFRTVAKIAGQEHLGVSSQTLGIDMLAEIPVVGGFEWMIIAIVAFLGTTAFCRRVRRYGGRILLFARCAQGIAGLIAAVLVTCVLVAMLSGCSWSTRRELERNSVASDPGSLSLEQGYNDYVLRGFLTNGTEVGIIRCRDGSSARYWFRSHHLTGDDGGTLFLFSDGRKRLTTGWFCCEVQLPEQQLASLDTLRDFIRTHDGISP